MKTRVGIVVALCVLAVAGWLMMTSIQSSLAADRAVGTQPQVGRYQMLREPRVVGNETWLLFDTATGKVWEHSDKRWTLYIEAPEK